MIGKVAVGSVGFAATSRKNGIMEDGVMKKKNEDKRMAEKKQENEDLKTQDLRPEEELYCNYRWSLGLMEWWDTELFL